MLKFLIWTVIVLAAVAMLVVAYAATRPNDFSISRSAIINAPPEVVFPLINDLRQFDRWNPFAKADPSIRLEYSGPDNGAGAKSTWDSSGSAGKGMLEITGSSAPSQINMLLHMIKPIRARNDIVFAVQTVAGGSNVSWTMRGKQPLIGKIISTFMSMDRMVGGPFERGLADLKILAEKKE